MTAYYNEFNPQAAHMLRQLIADGLIAPGDVDERSITEVQPDDIREYTQCHFFAGIGGWSVALRMAGWDDSRHVWTGSCPCQPFSTAGKQKGKSDERHLWPAWFRLIRECRPSAIFGEQVAAAITHGWWDDVANDLEAEGYACGAAVLPACSVGKPHRRDRLWFVANSKSERSGGTGWPSGEASWRSTGSNVVQPSGASIECGTMGNAELYGRDGSAQRGGASTGENQRGLLQSERPSASKYVANTISSGLQGHGRYEQQHGEGRWQEQNGYAGETDFQWIDCPDGKSRPVKPGIRLLADGVQHRAPILHAFGNAIVPQVAAAFIQASGVAA